MSDLSTYCQFGATVVELAFPSGDYNRGEAVADQIYAGAAHCAKEELRRKKEECADVAEAGGERAFRLARASRET